MNTIKLNEVETHAAQRLGFCIDVEPEFPRLIWMGGNGALTGHGRTATEAEVRMWFLIVGRHYTPWSLGEPKVNLIAAQRG